MSIKEKPDVKSTHVKSRCIGLVLNGGRSTRMGKPKGELLFKGKALLQHAIECTASCEVEQVCLASKYSKHNKVADGVGEISEQFTPSNLLICEDLYANKGPVSGIYSVVSQLGLQTGDILLVMPNDMPLMRADVLSYLIRNTAQTNNSCYFEDYYLPLSLLIDDTVCKKLREVEIQESTSIRSLLDDAVSLNLKQIFANEHIDSVKESFANINTLSEFESLG